MESNAHEATPHGHHHHRPAPAGVMAIDPVCGMKVDPDTARWSAEHDGKSVYFCCEGCRTKFLADPAKYPLREPEPAAVAPPAPIRPAVPASGGYTCPMHPEIRSPAPGPCPLCGMALEPVLITAEEGPNLELMDMVRRLKVALALAIPLVALDMANTFMPGGLLPDEILRWVEGLLATPVVLWGARPFFQRGWKGVRNHSPNMFTLIGMGVAVAYLASLAASVWPVMPVYYESAAVVVALALVGQVLELKARASTGDAIRALVRRAPKTARRIAANGSEAEVPVEQVQVGDRLRIRPGEAVPVDGVLLDGNGFIDEALVTGEAMPAAKKPGDRLIGATLNGTAALLMRAERVGADTMLARITALVAEAQRSRAPIQRLADAVAGWFVPVVILVAVATFAAWAWFGPAPGWQHGLVAAVAVLIVACPCALGLATPMAVMVGIGKGARTGVLIRSAEALERLAKIDMLVFDKTGTLTEGKPRLVEIRPVVGMNPNDMLVGAGAVEKGSEHPLAGAILAALRERDLTAPDATGVTALPGLGITGEVMGHKVAVGNARLMKELDIPVTAANSPTGGGTVIHVAIDGRATGTLAVADPIKEGTAPALAKLREDGIELAMLTGDARAAASAVGVLLGITRVHAELLPEDKHALVRDLRRAGYVVGMAGDGINDAAALAEADVGIAMGSGADVAIGAASVTLVSGDLAGIAKARALSRATMRNIRQNLALAFVYNLALVPVAAGVLYPLTGWLLDPMAAAAAMSLSSVSVIGNALRLRGVKL